MDLNGGSWKGKKRISSKGEKGFDRKIEYMWYGSKGEGKRKSKVWHKELGSRVREGRLGQSIMTYVSENITKNITLYLNFKIIF